MRSYPPPYRKVVMRRRAPEVITSVLESGRWVERSWHEPLIHDILECYHAVDAYRYPWAARRRCGECGRPGCDCGICSGRVRQR